MADLQEERDHFKRTIHTLESKLSRSTSENQASIHFIISALQKHLYQVQITVQRDRQR